MQSIVQTYKFISLLQYLREKYESVLIKHEFLSNFKFTCCFTINL
jgi:hypothetical protein